MTYRLVYAARAVRDGRRTGMKYAKILKHGSLQPKELMTQMSTRNTEVELLKRITVNPDIFGGKPIVRGMRMAVEHVLGMLAAGESQENLLREYPFLEAADIQACIAYAHRSLAGEMVHERIVGTKAS